MKSFLLYIVAVSIVVTSISAASIGGSSNNNGGSSSLAQEGDSDSQAQARAQPSNADVTRLRKAAYGAPSIPPLPCPKNYMFSCQPSMSAAPCSPSGSSYGSQAAYSAPVPAYVSPIYAGQDAPNGYATGTFYFAPQGLNYANANQYYQQYQ